MQQPLLPPLSPEVELSTLEDKYDHWSGGPDSSGADLMLPHAWRTHAKGYLRAGLAKDEAIDEHGFLRPEIDKSRHYQEGIKYFIATNPRNKQDMSTARLVRRQDIRDLPTYDLVKDGLDSTAVLEIQDRTTAGHPVQEVTALANSEPGPCPGSTEIMRRIVAESISTDDQSERLLFCSLVDVVLGGLRRSLTHANFRQVGDAVVLDENRYRNETTLIPVVIEPDKFIFNLLKASKEAERPIDQKRYQRNALLFANLYPNAPQVPEEIKDTLGRLAEGSEEDGNAA
jgi:hypothetical protein